MDLPTTPSERVYSELSGRSKLGTATANTVDNHESLFLHLRHARVMDNGEYTCVTETDTQTVTVDVQPPGGTSIKHRTTNHIKTVYILPYEMPYKVYAYCMYNCRFSLFPSQTASGSVTMVQ